MKPSYLFTILLLMVLTSTTSVYSQICGSNNQVNTNFFGLSGQDGIMFDVVANVDITINCFESYFTIGSLVFNEFEIWYKDGTLIGAETDPQQWTFIGRTSGFASPLSQSTLTEIPLNVNIPILAGNTAAFYITNGDSTNSNNQGIRYDGGGTIGNVTVSDQNLTIYDGKGAYDFFTVFSGSRIFSGRINYTTSTVNVNEKTLLEPVVYPNPAKDELFIQGVDGLQHIELFDISGRSMLKEAYNASGVLRISLNSLPRGSYTVKLLSAADELYFFPFVRQ